MSMTPQPTDVEETYDCSHCGGDRTASTSVAGSFCSTACYRAHQREKRADEVFELLEQDHRFCATCFAQLKIVHKPAGKSVVVPPSLHDSDWGNASDVLVGYQYRTDHAETGEISLDVDDDADRPIVEDGVATGTICRCGNTDHHHEESAIRERLPFTTAHRLSVATRTLCAEGKHDVHLDRRRLLDAVLDRMPIRGAFATAVQLD